MTRMVKTLRLDPSDPQSKIEVELEAVGDGSGFDVYLDGECIGRVSRYTGQTSRHLFGRVSTFGKPRQFWKATPPNDRSMLRRESMAAAIRWLLPG